MIFFLIILSYIFMLIFIFFCYYFHLLILAILSLSLELFLGLLKKVSSVNNFLTFFCSFSIVYQQGCRSMNPPNCMSCNCPKSTGCHPLLIRYTNIIHLLVLYWLFRDPLDFLLNLDNLISHMLPNLLLLWTQ